MYHLPLLPGYGPNANVRSSVPTKTKTGQSLLAHLSEVEENGYQGTYFTSPVAPSDSIMREGYITSSSPVDTRHDRVPQSADSSLVAPAGTDEETEMDRGFVTEPETPKSDIITDVVQTPVEIDPGAETDPGIYGRWKTPVETPETEILSSKNQDDEVAEVVFFEYGVVVFFGLEESQEKDILEDVENAGIMKRKINEDDWEIEECHYTHDPHIAYPRIYNDFFSESFGLVFSCLINQYFKL